MEVNSVLDFPIVDVVDFMLDAVVFLVINRPGIFVVTNAISFNFVGFAAVLKVANFVDGLSVMTVFIVCVV